MVRCRRRFCLGPDRTRRNLAVGQRAGAETVRVFLYRSQGPWKMKRVGGVRGAGAVTHPPRPQVLSILYKDSAISPQPLVQNPPGVLRLPQALFGSVGLKSHTTVTARARQNATFLHVKLRTPRRVGPMPLSSLS